MLPKKVELKKLYIFSFDVFTIKYTMFDFFTINSQEHSEDSLIEHIVKLEVSAFISMVKHL